MTGFELFLTGTSILSLLALFVLLQKYFYHKDRIEELYLSIKDFNRLCYKFRFERDMYQKQYRDLMVSSLKERSELIEKFTSKMSEYFDEHSKNTTTQNSTNPLDHM